MGLIKNSVEQGKQAVENISRSLKHLSVKADLDLVIVGAGPAGISASLAAKKHNLKTITLEQDTLGGTVFTFPRSKIVMTAPMDLPLHGKVKLYETGKIDLLNLWNMVLDKNNIEIQENRKVEKIISENGGFQVFTKEGDIYSTKRVLLAIGRRGTPRKLNIPGENLPKVAYRLLEPEFITRKDIVVVGGGDSAIESALLLAEQNRVTLSYRKDNFSRLKPKNNQKIKEAVEANKLTLVFNSNISRITEDKVFIQVNGEEQRQMNNDLVYIFAGGELPVQFLKNAGIKISRKFGEALLNTKNKERTEKINEKNH